MNWIDRAIGAVAPGAALRRLRQRQALGLMQRAYEGARIGRRTDGWVTAGSGANAEIAPALSRLRERSRDLVRNNPYETKAVHALVSNLVGTGIVPRARARRSTVAKAAASCGSNLRQVVTPMVSPISAGFRRSWFAPWRKAARCSFV